MNDSTELTNLLAQTRVTKQAYEEADKVKKKLGADLFQQARQLRALVEKGATTGDLIVDYVLNTSFGTLRPEQEQVYRDINAHLQGKTGQLVAFLWEDVEEECFGLALLRDDKLRMTLGENPSCGLPVDSYAICGKWGRKHEIRKEPFLEERSLSFEVMSEEKEKPSNAQQCAIRAGTEEVKKLFEFSYATLTSKDQEKMRLLLQKLGLLELSAE